MRAPSATHRSSRSRLRWVVRTGDRFPTTRNSGWSSSMCTTPVRFGRPDRFLLEAASSGYQRRSVKVVAAARGMAVAPLTAELARSLQSHFIQQYARYRGAPGRCRGRAAHRHRGAAGPRRHRRHPCLLPADRLGPVRVTAGGLVFIGATNDHRFRAFDAKSGTELWVADLPASGHSTPVTYMGKDSKQYVVIAASGGTAIGGGRPLSDALVAFRLPN